jgi:hypothetical protein
MAAQCLGVAYMLGGMLNWKWYVGIGIVAAVLFYVIGLVDTGFIEQNLLNLRRTAISVGMAPGIADVVVQPVIAVFNNGIVGAVIGGVLWPFSFLWLLLVTMLFFFTVLGSGFSQAADTIRE